MGQTLDSNDVFDGRRLRIVSSCWSNLARSLRKHASIKLPDATMHPRFALWSSRPPLDHARAQLIVRDLFEQPWRKALQDGARSSPPRGSARPLRRRRSPLWGGTSERRRLRGEAGRGVISRRSARSPGAVAHCCPIRSEFVQGGHLRIPIILNFAHSGFACVKSAETLFMLHMDSRARFCREGKARWK